MDEEPTSSQTVHNTRFQLSFGFPQNENLRKIRTFCGMEGAKKPNRLCIQYFEESQMILNHVSNWNP